MAKGASSKELITKKILEMFPDAFIHEKLIRIPLMEAGEPIEIKVTLTAAKDIVGSTSNAATAVETSDAPVVPATSELIEPTEEEKANIESLLASLGLS